MTSPTIGKTCPYCQTLIAPGAPALACPSCGMPHHQDCWQENGGCTTFGCAGAQPARRGARGALPHGPLPAHHPAWGMPPGRGVARRSSEHVALLLGILSIACGCGLLGIPAIVLGGRARLDPRAHQGVATAGVVLGALGLMLNIILLFIILLQQQ